jgi:hypothetical protein
MNDDADDNPTLAAWRAAEAALAEAEQDSSEEGRARQIYIADKIADSLYLMHDTLKSQGRTEAADICHAEANRFWAKVVRLVGDGTPAPKNSGTDTLSVREAANQLTAMRAAKLST